MAKQRKNSGTEEEKESPTNGDKLHGVGGIMGGIGTILEKLADLAERGEELRALEKLGGKPMHGVVGFTIKTALDKGGGFKVEPFGNVGSDKRTGKAAVHEVAEPMVDILDEAEKVLVVVEMPGIGEDDLHMELHEDILTISAERGRKKYRKEVLLPASFSSAQMKHTCRNGVVEIQLAK
jgi:HSP20 family protein